jgi:hypothetical protein
MPCGRALNPHSKIANAVAGTWKARSSQTGHVWIAFSWSSSSVSDWLAHLAASCLHHGQRTQFDRHDRRDKGIFRLGRLWLLDILRRAATATSLRRCLLLRAAPTGWAFSLRF